MECRICTRNVSRFAETMILSRYTIQYYVCKNCGFLQTEEPYWLQEAYQDSINIYDTGILQRNIDFSKRTAVLLHTLFDDDFKCLDYGGGYGIFCRLMRDMGFDFFWHDPYTKNLVARGFEYTGNQKINFITAFECFEHFQYPFIEIGKLLEISDTIFFSTLLPPTPTPLPKDWWYFGLNHGQHIAFYSEKTLRFIAEHFKLKLYSNGTYLHLFVTKAPNIRNLNFLMKLKFLLMGKEKINRLIKQSDKLYHKLHHRFDSSLVVEDMLHVRQGNDETVGGK